jgi:hypothetical protein
MIPIRAKKPIKKAANQGAITLNQAMDLTGQLLERLDYGGNLGLSYGGLRDIYLELGTKRRWIIMISTPAINAIRWPRR